MEDKVIKHQIKFLRDKVAQLTKEKENEKLAGERRIQKMEGELRQKLDRIQEQINGFENKAKVLEMISSQPS